MERQDTDIDAEIEEMKWNAKMQLRDHLCDQFTDRLSRWTDREFLLFALVAMPGGTFDVISEWLDDLREQIAPLAAAQSQAAQQLSESSSEPIEVAMSKLIAESFANRTDLTKMQRAILETWVPASTE